MILSASAFRLPSLCHILALCATPLAPALRRAHASHSCSMEESQVSVAGQVVEPGTSLRWQCYSCSSIRCPTPANDQAGWQELRAEGAGRDASAGVEAQDRCGAVPALVRAQLTGYVAPVPH